MRNLFVVVVVFGILAAFQVSAVYAGDQKLGKIFIKAAATTVDGQVFSDKGREDSVKDLRERAGDFVAVNDEKEAEFLLVIVGRVKNSNKAELSVTLSFKEDGQWKPGTRLTAEANSWSMAARRIMGQASDWVNEQKQKV